MPEKKLLNEREVAEQLGVSVAAVRRWRLEKRGPAWCKVESLVRYEPAALEEYLRRRVVSAQEAA
ncbi:MAG TPA: helix-turn-helix domain-containing protein [Bryobacteraceae bacterium]|nr:helix-turn-helix domain-containing protein [Bryobacteraceae bacterium]